HHENPESQQHDKRGSVQQDGDPVARARVLDGDVDLLFVQKVDQRGIVRRHLRVKPKVRVLIQSMRIAIGDGYVLHFTGPDLVQKLGESKILFLRSVAGPDDGKQIYRHHDKDYPEN